MSRMGNDSLNMGERRKVKHFLLKMFPVSIPKFFQFSIFTAMFLTYLLAAISQGFYISSEIYDYFRFFTLYASQ